MKTKNDNYKLEFKRYQWYSTESEAKQKGIRMEILLNKLSRVEQDPQSGKYWVLLAHGKGIHSPINNRIDSFENQGAMKNG